MADAASIVVGGNPCPQSRSVARLRAWCGGLTYNEPRGEIRDRKKDYCPGRLDVTSGAQSVLEEYAYRRLFRISDAQ